MGELLHYAVHAWFFPISWGSLPCALHMIGSPRALTFSVLTSLVRLTFVSPKHTMPDLPVSGVFSYQARLNRKAALKTLAANSAFQAYQAAHHHDGRLR